MSSVCDVEAPASSPTKSDEYGELDFVVVDEVDNVAPSASSPPPSNGDGPEVSVDANSNLTATRVYRRREKKALALSLIDDIALQSGTSRKTVGSVTDKFTSGRGEAANSPAISASSPPPLPATPVSSAIVIPSSSAPPSVSATTNWATAQSSSDDVECVRCPHGESARSSAKDEEQEATTGCPINDKKRRQGSKSPSKSGLVRRKTITMKDHIASDQMLSICLPRYNWLEKKLHDVSKCERQQDIQIEHNTPTTVESSVDTASKNSPIILRNPKSNVNRDLCNSNAKSVKAKGELIEVPDDDEPICHWSECVIVDDEVASEDSVPGNCGDNEPILLPKIDTSTPDLPFQLHSAGRAGNSSENHILSHDNTNSDTEHSNSTDSTNNNNNNNSHSTVHDKKLQPPDDVGAKQDDSQDDVVLIGVTPAKEGDGFTAFNCFGGKANRGLEANFIDLCSKRTEDFENPIHLLNSLDGDHLVPQGKNAAEDFEGKETATRPSEFQLHGRVARNSSESMDMTKDQRVVTETFENPFGLFDFERTAIAALDDKKEPKIYETCQLLYRKIQSIVTKSKSPEESGANSGLTESARGNACRSLQDAINTAMVKAMGEDFDKDVQKVSDVKPVTHFSGIYISDRERIKTVPHRPSSSDQTHLPPKKRALSIEDSGTANASNRSPPLSKRRKTTSRIQKVRPILLTEGEEDKNQDEVTIIKAHGMSMATVPPVENASGAVSPWPGSSTSLASSVQSSPNRPLSQQSGGMTPDLLKLNGLPAAASTFEIAWEKLQTANAEAKLKASMLMSTGKRGAPRKKIPRRSSHSEYAPHMLTAKPAEAFKLDSPATEQKSTDYFYNDNDDGRYVHFKDGTVAFKEMRALQEPFSHSANRYTYHVDLTRGSPTHPPGAVASQSVGMHKMAWHPGSHKSAPGLEHSYHSAASSCSSQSPISQHGSYASSTSSGGFFECLPHRSHIQMASSSWMPSKPKTMPDTNVSDGNATVGHAFHPVTPSNKLASYTRYHQPPKSCHPPGQMQIVSSEASRSAINPQPGALTHHPMLSMTTMRSPSHPMPFSHQIGVPAPPPPPPPPPPHVHSQIQAQTQMQPGYQTIVSTPGWMPSLSSRGLATSTGNSQKISFMHHSVSHAKTPKEPQFCHSMGASYDPRASHMIRPSSESFPAPGQMLATRFAGATAAAAAAAAAMYPLPRQSMQRGQTPDASQMSAFWPGTAHAMPAVPPHFTKQ